MFFLTKVNRLEKEEKLKQHVEDLKQVAEKLEEKHSRITELENLVQRMEKVCTCIAYRIRSITKENNTEMSGILNKIT